MLMAGADSQFGHEALVVSEMSRAHDQAKEAAVYGGAVTSGPTGITGTTGVTSITAITAAITYDDVLSIPTALAAINLPVENAKFLISVVARQVLTGVQKFAIRRRDRAERHRFPRDGKRHGRARRVRRHADGHDGRPSDLGLDAHLHR